MRCQKCIKSSPNLLNYLHFVVNIGPRSALGLTMNKTIKSVLFGVYTVTFGLFFQRKGGRNACQRFNEN